MNLPYTLVACAKLAIDCQDACNLSGVANSLANNVMPRILDEMRRRGKDTEWANRHPIVYLFLHKMVDLCAPDQSGFLEFSKQYELVKELAAGKEVY
jgi:hypothetical protein